MLNLQAHLSLFFVLLLWLQQDQVLELIADILLGLNSTFVNKISWKDLKAW